MFPGSDGRDWCDNWCHSTNTIPGVGPEMPVASWWCHWCMSQLGTTNHHMGTWLVYAQLYWFSIFRPGGEQVTCNQVQHCMKVSLRAEACIVGGALVQLNHPLLGLIRPKLGLRSSCPWCQTPRWCASYTNDCEGLYRGGAAIHEYLGTWKI